MMFRVYDATNLQTAIGLIENFFATRAKGELAYPILLEQVQSLPDGGTLVIRFPDEQLLDGSFADEVIVRLGQELVQGEFGQKRVALKNLTDDSIANLNRAINYQKLRLAFFVFDDSDKWQIVGHIEKSLHEVFDMMGDGKPLTAPELAESLGIALNTANNRLKRLFEQRLIRRKHRITDQGLTYVYSLWLLNEEGDA